MDEPTKEDDARNEAPPSPPPLPPAAPPWWKSPYLLIVLASIAILSGALWVQATSRIERLGYASPDEALNLQIVWNGSHRGAMTYTVEAQEEPWERHGFSSHIVLPFFLYMVVMAVFPGYAAIFALQIPLTLAVAIPLFVFARRRLGSERRAAAIACLALVYPLLDANAIRFGAYFNLGVPLLVLAIERLDAGRLRAAGIAFVLALGTREELAIPIAAFLLPLAIASPERRRFYLLVGGGALAYLAAVLLLRPIVFGPGPNFLARYAHLGGSVPAFFVSPLARPGAFFGHLFAPKALALAGLMLLPLLPGVLAAPRHLLAAAAPWAIVALSSVASDKVLGHYLVPALPFLFTGTVVGLERLDRWGKDRFSAKVSLAFYGLVATSVLTVCAWVSDVGPFKRYAPLRCLDQTHLGALEANTPEYAAVNALARSIPPEASVSASVHSLVLVCTRRTLHPFPVRRQAVDFLLIDTRHRAPSWPASFEEHAEGLKAALAEPGVKTTWAGPFVLVDRREIP